MRHLSTPISVMTIALILSIMAATDKARADHDFLGRWQGIRQHVALTVEIYKENEKFFMFTQKKDGSTSSKKLERKLDDHGRQVFRTLDRDYIKRTYVLTANNRLEVLEEDGRTTVFEPVAGAVSAIIGSEEQDHHQASGEHHGDEHAHANEAQHHD